MKIAFKLLDNAKDSLDRAFDLIAWVDDQKDASRLKQAVQAVAHAIELLLKERLQKLHPSLIWENVDHYPNLNSRTVGTERAVDRLKNIGGIEFTTSDLQLIRALRTTRNAIEHFSWNTTKIEAEVILGRSLEFAFHFARTELSIEYLDYSFHKDGTYEDLVAANPEFGRAVERRRLTSDNTSLKELNICSSCRGRAVDAASKVCKLCGSWEFDLFESDDYIPL
jgi:hypothetical protein